MKRPTVAAAALLFIAGCNSAKEQPAPASGSNVVQWTASSSPARRGPGNSILADIEVRARVGQGWHVYSLTQGTGGPTPLTIKVSAPYHLDGAVAGPAPDKAQDSNFGIETETYSGEPVFRVPVKLDDSAGLAPPPVTLEIRSQACSDQLCLPARKTTVTVTPELGTT